jgi:hypothetical protein
MTDTTCSHRSFGDVVSRTVAAETAGGAEAFEVLLDEEFRGDDPFCPAIEGPSVPTRKDKQRWQASSHSR